MSGFEASWLALRTPADARARSLELETALRDELRQALHAGFPHVRPWLAADLACGTGSNVVRLAPRLPGPQRWRLVDSDDALLRHARERCVGLVDAAGAPAHATVERADLAGPALEAACAGARLVTASALLDLVSAAWLDRLASACARAGAIALCVLDYDGRRSCAPADPDDAAAHAAFDAHQRRDKGFGPALGPDACVRAAAAFAARGYRVRRARSDRQLDAADAADAALQRELLRGWAAAAIEAVPGERGRFEGWLERRLAHVDAGRSVLLVGHEDLLAIPGGRDS
ncbi:MAG: class I SAM-dependent methyltransferase [Pseudomonadota bacterium]